MTRRHIDMSPAASDAALILARQVRLARQGHNWTSADLAARAGVSVNTVLSIEAGRSTPSIGNVLNVAAIAGVPLFGAEDSADLARVRRTSDAEVALLPKRVRHPKVNDADYDF